MLRFARPTRLMLVHSLDLCWCRSMQTHRVFIPPLVFICFTFKFSTSSTSIHALVCAYGHCVCSRALTFCSAMGKLLYLFGFVYNASGPNKLHIVDAYASVRVFLEWRNMCGKTCRTDIMAMGFSFSSALRSLCSFFYAHTLYAFRALVDRLGITSIVSVSRSLSTRPLYRLSFFFNSQFLRLFRFCFN